MRGKSLHCSESEGGLAGRGPSVKRLVADDMAVPLQERVICRWGRKCRAWRSPRKGQDCGDCACVCCRGWWCFNDQIPNRTLQLPVTLLSPVVISPHLIHPCSSGNMLPFFHTRKMKPLEVKPTWLLGGSVRFKPRPPLHSTTLPQQLHECLSHAGNHGRGCKRNRRGRQDAGLPGWR